MSKIAWEHEESNSSGILMADRLSKRRRFHKPSNRYIDTSFIAGAVVEVEHLWSMAKNILTDNRQSMTPQNFKALLFLNVKYRLWNVSLVSVADNSIERKLNGGYTS